METLATDLHHRLHALELVLRVVVIVAVPVLLGLVSALWGTWLVARENRRVKERTKA